VYQDTLHQYDVTLDHPDEAPVAAPLSPPDRPNPPS
jgi:hypothetical protein